MSVPPRPISGGYWVVPGKLGGGPYAASWIEDRALERLARLLRAGITYFVDLTEEALSPSYGPWLQAAAARLEMNATYRRFDIRDMDVPEDALMVSALDAIDAAIHLGETLYVHCLAGLGRTGTVIGCWLARHGTTGRAALDELSRLRAGLNGASPQTDAQRRMVLSWRAGT